MATRIGADGAEDLPEGLRRLLRTGACEIALSNVQHSVYAIDAY